MKKILLSLLAIGMINSAFAIKKTSGVVSQSATKVVANVATNSITPINVINESSLDLAWANRDDLNSQKATIDFLLTKPKYDKDNYVVDWKLARLVSYLGNFGYGYSHILTNTSKGIEFFEYGYKAAEAGINLQAKGVEANYWFALNLGSYGLLKGILSSAANAGPGMDALKLVKDSQQDSYENYGAYRILGRYYQELPGVFGGSDTKAEDSLKLAVNKSNGFINNYVFLGEFYLYKKDYAKAKEMCNKALTTTNKAQTGSENIRYIKEATECVKKAENNA